MNAGRGTMEGCRSGAPPLDAAVDIPEKPSLFRGFLRWKKVRDDFFHGQRRQAAPVLAEAP